MKPRLLPRLSLSTRSPLARLLRQREQEPEFTRARRFGHLLEPFHLRYTVTEEVNGRSCVVNGRRVIHFASANYLGLEQHPEVLYAAKRAIDELGLESGCSRIVSTHANVLELEESLAILVGAEAVLVDHSASQLHAAAVPALFGAPDCVLFLDRHASSEIRQAALAATARGARVVRVDVSDPPALARILGRERAAAGALLLDGVHPVHGLCPDLAFLDELCREHGLALYVDDSHGVGVVSAGGAAAEAGFENLVLVASLQKGLGAYGAFLAGSSALVDIVRASLHTNGTLQPAAVEAALASVRIARSAEGRRLREDLAALSKRVRTGLSKLGFVVAPGESPIVSIAIGRDLKTLMALRKLFDLGVLVSSAVFPEAPHGKGSLRVCLTTLHGERDLEALFTAFRELRQYLPKYENPLREAAHMLVEAGKAKWLGTAYGGL